MKNNAASISVRWHRWLRDECGSYTLESALVFPLIMILTIGLVFASIYVYQSVVVYAQASLTADRTAFVWNNSHKDPVTGNFAILERDPLYWRFTSDQTMFPFQLFSGADHARAVYVPGTAAPAANGMKQRKLLRGMSATLGGLNGEARYQNHWWESKVTVQVGKPFFAPIAVNPVINQDEVAAGSRSWVVDPVEFIRNIDFVASVLPAVKSAFTSEDVNEKLKPFHNLQDVEDVNPSLAFAHHDDAMRYLQGIVDGVNSSEPTTDVGYRRMVDARDANNIAHQCYIGHKTLTSNLQYQMDKDIELLQKGVFSGVVWHFFRRESDGRVGPTDALRQELEHNGIIVVIHE